MEQLYSVKGQIIDPAIVYVAQVGGTTLEGRVKGVVGNKLVLESVNKYSPDKNYESVRERHIPLHNLDHFAPAKEFLVIAVPDNHTLSSLSPQSPWGYHAVLQESHPPSGNHMPNQS